MSPRPSAPLCYELRVAGLLDDSWSTWFDGMGLVREDDGTTTLRGVVTDQAALHGHLAKVRDLGTTLISVKVVDALPEVGLHRQGSQPGVSTARRSSPSRMRSRPHSNSSPKL